MSAWELEGDSNDNEDIASMESVEFDDAEKMASVHISHSVQEPHDIFVRVGMDTIEKSTNQSRSRTVYSRQTRQLIAHQKAANTSYKKAIKLDAPLEERKNGRIHRKR